MNIREGFGEGNIYDRLELIRKGAQKNRFTFMKTTVRINNEVSVPFIIVGSFLQNLNQLVHIVVSPEGLWIVSVSYEFQVVLKMLKLYSDSQCFQSLEDSIFKNFTIFDKSRYKSEVLHSIVNR